MTYTLKKMQSFLKSNSFAFEMEIALYTGMT